MNTSGIYIHSASAPGFSGLASKLHEGSLVSVRVLAKNPDGRFIISFAGHKVLASSQKQLEIGSVFKAQLFVKDGNLELVLENALQKNGFSIKNLTADVQGGLFAPLSDSELSSFFTNIGLVPDLLTLKIFQQLQQLGARLDFKLLAKIRAMAMKFPGRETLVAESALLFEKKGIEVSENLIETILDEIDGHSEYDCENNSEKKHHSSTDSGNHENSGKHENSGNHENPHNDGNPEKSHSDGGKSSAHSQKNKSAYADLKNFSDISEKKSTSSATAPSLESIYASYKKQVFDLKSKLYRQTHNFSLLPLFNHLSETFDNSLHWIVLPCTFTLQSGSSGQGIIRIFMEPQKQSVKKMIICADIKRHQYLFVLYFHKDRRITDVLFSIEPLDSFKIQKIKARLEDVFSKGESVNVSRIENEGSPFFTENTPVSFAEGSV